VGGTAPGFEAGRSTGFGFSAAGFEAAGGGVVDATVVGGTATGFVDSYCCQPYTPATTAIAIPSAIPTIVKTIRISNHPFTPETKSARLLNTMPAPDRTLSRRAPQGNSNLAFRPA